MVVLIISFNFHPYLGKMIHFDYYSSDGLKPQARISLLEKTSLFSRDLESSVLGFFKNNL